MIKQDKVFIVKTRRSFIKRISEHEYSFINVKTNSKYLKLNLHINDFILNFGILNNESKDLKPNVFVKF